MIFLTVGSHEPFDRLVRAVDQVASSMPLSKVFGQITDRASYHPTGFEYTDVLGPDEYRLYCTNATCLVAHAGMGSIITAMELRKPIVIMPRSGQLGETRNDHQFTTAERFADRPGIFVASDETGVGTALERALAWQSQEPGNKLPPFAEDRLISFLKSQI